MKLRYILLFSLLSLLSCGKFELSNLTTTANKIENIDSVAIVSTEIMLTKRGYVYYESNNKTVRHAKTTESLGLIVIQDTLRLNESIYLSVQSHDYDNRIVAQVKLPKKYLATNPQESNSYLVVGFTIYDKAFLGGY